MWFKAGQIAWIKSQGTHLGLCGGKESRALTHTHTRTHTERVTERERERVASNFSSLTAMNLGKPHLPFGNNFP
jgi:hypothetical protein